MTKIGVVGAGSMGKAMICSLAKTFPKETLYVCDRDIDKLSHLPIIHYSTDENPIVAEADVVILAIKPQSFDEFCANVHVDTSKKIIVSIMAGVGVEIIQRKLKTPFIVRSMPNLAVQVGMGFTAWFAAPNIKNKGFIKEIFSSFGCEMEIAKEELLHAITALSGSGPAYFFYMSEILKEKALAFGFSEEEARMIVEKTFVGSAKLLEMHSKSVEEWRQAVTSKGGTTEAAIQHLESHGFKDIFFNALEQAEQRSQRIGKKLNERP